MVMVRYSFDLVAKILPHFSGKVVAKTGFQKITNAAFSTLAVNANNIGLVFSAHICRVNGKVGNIPLIEIVLFAPFHSFGNGILMAARKCSKYQCSGIGGAVVYLHFAADYEQTVFSFLKRDIRNHKKEIGEVLSRAEEGTKRLMALQKLDGKIGYEASNHYFYTTRSLKEKLLNLYRLKEELNSL